MTTPAPHCPLCDSRNTARYHQDKKRSYYQCNQCELVFACPESFLSQDQEKAEYLLHENSAEDAGYRRFLSRLSTPLLETLPAGLHGLDFGCGPNPVLAEMLAQSGMTMSVFDPFFAPDTDLLSTQYDFITCTEAIEHFHKPMKEITLLSQLVKPGGLLAVMTKRVISQQRFSTWHYKNDPTHVSFFSEATFHYIARTFGFAVSFPAADVVFMQKEP